MRYYVQGKYIKKSTNVFVNPSDWDNKKQEVKSRNRQATVLNAKLNSFKQNIDEQLLAFRAPSHTRWWI